jgi:metal-responsive CopG/Arc/MetJ family transcriptional regulator
MKTAVSIPDEIFAQAERLANRAKRSRSEVYASALAEYVARHAPDRVTEAMDRVLDQIDEREAEFAARSARQTLERTEW